MRPAVVSATAPAPSAVRRCARKKAPPTPRNVLRFMLTPCSAGVRAQPEHRRADVGVYEALGCDRGAGETPQHRELPRMRHGIRERPLQQLLERHSLLEWSVAFEAVGEVPKDAVKPRDLPVERREADRDGTGPRRNTSARTRARRSCAESVQRRDSVCRPPGGTSRSRPGRRAASSACDRRGRRENGRAACGSQSWQCVSIRSLRS